MALLLNADAEIVEFAAASSLDFGTSATFCMWVRPTDDTLRQTLFLRDGLVGGAGGVAYVSLSWRADLAGDEFQFNRETAGTDIGANANAANFAAYGLNKWLFIACVYDDNSATATDQKILMGDLTTPAAEPSAYTSQTAGTLAGSTNYGTAVLAIGNNNASTTREFNGDFAFFSAFNVALTNQQIIAHQFRPRKTPDTVFISHLHGTGTQRDYSGNAVAGTVTGATNSGAHVPLR